MNGTLDKGLALMSAWWYRHYVLGLLFLSYVVNVMDRSSVLAVSLQSIKAEFGASDTQLGLLSGIAFAVFYLDDGHPDRGLADRSSRRNVLAVSVAVWSGMTALCGMAVNFAMLFATRVGTAIGEAGGSPPSHSLISDYFPKTERGRAFAIFALGVPFGTALGSFVRARRCRPMAGAPRSCWSDCRAAGVGAGLPDHQGAAARDCRTTPARCGSRPRCRACSRR